MLLLIIIVALKIVFSYNLYRTNDESPFYINNKIDKEFINIKNNKNYDINYSSDNISNKAKRSIYRYYSANWKPPIYYYIGDGLNKRKISSALKDISENTCILFIPTNDIHLNKSKIIYQLSTQCSSFIAQQNHRDRTILLTKECSDILGLVQHETNHGLGVLHEHQRFDRDKYVEIIDGNIPKEYGSDILTIGANTTYITLNVSYDYGSLMHYPGSSYISNFKPYMLAKNVDPYNKMMGQSYRLSFNDFKLLNLYFCSKNCLGSEHKCKNGGYLHWIQCGTCICPKGFQGRDCGYIKPISHYCNETILVASKEEKILSLEKNKTCNYLIRSESKTKVYVSITRVQTRERKDKGDVCLPHLGFEIRYLNDKGITGLSLCGRYNDIVIVSQGPEVYIEYHGLDPNNYFVLSYADTTSNFTESRITYEGKSFKVNN